MLVIDTNCFSSVFVKDVKDHYDFEPIHEFIYQRRGILAYGGQVYNRELARARRFLPIFAELGRRGQLRVLDGDQVDAEMRRVERLESDTDFDDPHLVAIVIVGCVKVICSKDSKGYFFWKQARFYPRP